MAFRAHMRQPRRRWFVSIIGVCLLGLGADTAAAQDKPAAVPAATADTGKLPMAQLEALVAPIALYPDPLLAQTLVASTYPLEIIQLQQWMAKHPDLKDKALADSVAKQPWDPSIQSMAVIPDVVKRLADDIQWTTELGNAFLAQQTDVMDAVQVMRKKAMANGALASNEQQKVDTQVVEKQTVIVVQPTNPEVVYVPVYTPTVVYGPPAYYPYPPIYYPPPPPPGAYLVAFTVGVVWRSAVWGGSCCYAGWGHSNNTVIINNNNNFNQINHNGGGGNNNWQHNPSHRGGTPYPNNSTANKYGGQAGGAGGRSPSASTRPAGGAGQAGGAGGRAPSAGTQPAGGAGGRAPTASTKPAGGAGQAGGGSARVPSASTQPAKGTGGNQVGGRDVPSSKGGQSGFSGGQGGYSGSSARASSSRGASSMGGSSYGGSRGGGRWLTGWRRAPLMRTMTMGFPYRLGLAVALCGVVSACGDQKGPASIGAGADLRDVPRRR